MQGRHCDNGHALTRHGHKVRASPHPFGYPYVKELVRVYTSGGKDFVSGKQKSAIFGKFFSLQTQAQRILKHGQRPKYRYPRGQVDF
jgi:hypothetical protein